MFLISKNRLHCKDIYDDDDSRSNNLSLNIKGLQHQVANIHGLENLSLWKRFNYNKKIQVSLKTFETWKVNYRKIKFNGYIL